MAAAVSSCTPGNGGGNDEPELDYELRVLTFEDADYKGSEPSETYWSDFIPSGPYGNGNARYSWYDEGNTELAYNVAFSLYGMGGHAGISNYVGNDLSLGDYTRDLEAYNVAGGANGSQNFCVHFGYLDDSGMGMMDKLIYFEFQDGTARVIDHMWVTNTNYTLNQLYNGVKSEEGNSFGGNWSGLTESAWLKIIAQGFDDIDADAYAEPVSEVEFYLVLGEDVVTDWEKWDLSPLGTVAKVRFNFEYSEEMGGRYGFTIPGYFAYDDIAVRFDK